MNKIITKEQAEHLANYLLKSTIPSVDAQNWAAMLRGLPDSKPAIKQVHNGTGDNIGITPEAKLTE